jgi:hypothetical protein
MSMGGIRLTGCIGGICVYYDGTVEAKVYRKLRDHIDALATVVGKLQPILAKVPTFIERAVMSADPEEEDVLLSEFEDVLDTPPLRPALDDMVEMDIQADLEMIQQPIAQSPVTPDSIETLFTQSLILRSGNIHFTRIEDNLWQINIQGQDYSITFSPDKFEENPSLRLMLFGDPLFHDVLEIALR